MSRYLDISVPTSPQTTVYPGDPSPKIEWPYWAISKGNPANVGFFNGGLHHGTHVDAPWHFVAGGKRIDEVGLDPFIGPCLVIDAGESSCITADILEREPAAARAKRLLFKTRNSRTEYWSEPWNSDFVYLRKDAAQWCVDHGIVLVGLDYLTIDPPNEPEFPSHLILLGAGTVILENINLLEVCPGEYELLAAPVKLLGADGAWTRALLRKE
jgi:arylformamidase